MKLLQINITVNNGSTGRIAEEIGVLAQSQGWESYIAFSRGKAISESNLIRIGNVFDTYIHGVQTRLLDNHGLGSVVSTLKLIKKIKEISPDIIHLHNIHGYYLNYPLLFKYLSESNIPVVWTLHDCWSFTGHCAYYTYVNCNKWKVQCFDCPQKKNYPASILIDRSRLNYKNKKDCFTSIPNMVLVTVSDWLSNEVQKSFLNKYSIKTIHNGIDLKTFTINDISKNKLSLENSFIILGVANVWEPRKGLADFIHLRNLLSSKYVIILIGLTQKQIDDLPEGIIGIKRTNSINELAQYYSMSDIYVNLSVEETFGMTTCESMACGTPVIVYNSTACPEIVTKETGFVVESGDLKSVVECIKVVQENGKEKYKYACRKRVIQYYNKEDKYREYLQLYNQLLKSKNENISNYNNL